MTNQQQLNDFAGVFDLKIVFTLITVVYLYILIFTDRHHHTKTKTVGKSTRDHYDFLGFSCISLRVFWIF